MLNLEHHKGEHDFNCLDEYNIEELNHCTSFISDLLILHQLIKILFTNEVGGIILSSKKK